MPGSSRLAGLVREACERVERWAARRAGVLLAAVVLVGAALRLADWGRFWVNPDEGLYVYIIGLDREAARAGIAGNALPPLYYEVLRCIAALGGGIDAMRAPSLVAGVLLIPAMYGVGRLWGGALAGLFAAFLLAVSPSAVALSVVMRPYALQLLLLASGLLVMTRLLSRPTVLAAAALAACFSLAVLLHYGSMVAVGGSAAWVGWLAVQRRLDRRRLLLLGSALTFCMGVCGVLYLTHIGPNLMGSAVRAAARSGWLAKAFVGSPLHAVRNLVRVSGYLFGSFSIPLATLLVAIACGSPAGPPSTAPPGDAGAPPPRPAWLSVSWLLTGLAFSAVGLYPFGPTRHSMYLAVVVAPAIGVAVAALLRARNAWAGLAGLVCAAFLGVGALRPGTRLILPETFIPRDAARALMARLDSEVAPGDAVLIDWQTLCVLAPSLESAVLGRIEEQRGPVRAFESAGRLYLVFQGWNLVLDAERDDVGTQLAWLAARDPGARPWLLQGGWGVPLAATLPESLPDGAPLRGPDRGVAPFVLAPLDPAGYRRYASASRTVTRP